MSLSPRNSQKKNNLWQIQQAKARFSELVNQAQKEGIQVITKNGEQVAVVLSKKEFDQLKRPQRTLLQIFKESPLPEIDLDLERQKDLPRDIDL